MLPICIESGVGAHVDDATIAWVHDARWWGLCGQGTDEPSALADLASRAYPTFSSFLDRHGRSAVPLEPVEVVERIHGDEQAFRRDLEPATAVEVEATLEVLGAARQELVELIGGCTDTELDWDDPRRELPSWARWRTLRQMALHVMDTESRYYLAALGIEPPPRAADLGEGLRRSHRHVVTSVRALKPDLVVRRGAERWSTRKVLRRLAWHERSELDAMRELLARAREARGST